MFIVSYYRTCQVCQLFLVYSSGISHMGAMLVDKVLSERKWFDKTVNLHDILVAGTA